MAAAALSMLVAVTAAPAWGQVDKSPNALSISDVSCPDAGLSFDAIWLPTIQTLAGHDLDANRVGVAKSIHATDSLGNPLVELFRVPGRGLASITVWCFWADPDSPTGFVGGDILFSAGVRP